MGEVCDYVMRPLNWRVGDYELCPYYEFNKDGYVTKIKNMIVMAVIS